jgi:hypothetical protein
MPRNGDSARRRRTPRISRARRTDDNKTTLSHPEILEPRKVFTGDSVLSSIDMITLPPDRDSQWFIDLPAPPRDVVPPSTIAPAISPISIGVLPRDHLVAVEPFRISRIPGISPPVSSIAPNIAPPFGLPNPITITVGPPTFSTAPLQSVAEEPVEACPPNVDPTPRPPWTGESSETQTQVEGVDEADLVETDGTLLYTLSRDGVLSIIDHSTHGSPTVLTQLKVAHEHETVTGMFLNDGLLTIIRTSSLSIHRDGEVDPTTTVTVLNVSAPEEPILVRDLQIDGAFVDSRMIDGKLLLVTQEMLLPSNETAPITVSRITAHALDTSAETVAAIDSVAFLSVGTLDTFASADSLYIFSSQNNSTTIHKIAYDFADDENPLDLVASDIVAGRFLNQFAADEHEGHLRLVLETPESTAVPAT